MKAIDCEWNRQGKLLCLAFISYDELGNQTDAPKIIPANDSEIYKVLDKWKESNELLVGHNIKSDLLTIYENTGILLENVWDTMIATQQLSNGKDFKVGLGNCILKILGIEVDKSLQTSFLDKEDYLFSDEERAYILNDIQHLIPLKNKLEYHLKDKGMLDRCFKIDMKCLPVLALIEATGMNIDKEKWSKLIDEWKIKRIDLHKSIIDELESLEYPVFTEEIKRDKIIRKELNLNSHLQVKSIFRYFKITLPHNKEDKESTNKDLLASINIDTPDNILNKFIELFVEYKKVTKLITGFGDNIILNLRNGLTLHTEYTQCFTATGRLSSGKNKLKPYTINVQNIPARSIEGKKIMECVVAREGYNIVCCDMSGAELRIAGSLSKDELLIANFNAGGDFHSELATCSWQVIYNNQEVISKKFNPKWLDSDFRTTHKQVNFGYLYGCSDKRISEVLHILKSIAGKCKTAIAKKVPKLTAYLKSNQDKARKQGYLIAPYTNRIKYNLTPTEASNWVIQCLNSEAMKVALYRLYGHIKTNNIDAKIINSVHDSAILEVKEGIDVNWIKDIVAESLGLFLEGIKGEADLSINKHWEK